MNLAELLRFVPLGIGLFLAYHLIMKEGLPNKNLGKVLTYFLGIIIVFVAIRWLINSFFASWANDLLSTGNSTEINTLIDTSENIIQNAFSAQPVAAPTQQTISEPAAPPPGTVVTPTPLPAGQVAPETLPGGAQTYTVVSGDTLYDIALRFGTDVDSLMRLNNLTSYIIQPGQQLQIPAR